MEFVIILLALLVASGFGLAAYEWRRGSSLIREDPGDGPARQTEADRDAVRASDHMANRPAGE